MAPATAASTPPGLRPSVSELTKGRTAQADRATLATTAADATDSSSCSLQVGKCVRFGLLSAAY